MKLRIRLVLTVTTIIVAVVTSAMLVVASVQSPLLRDEARKRATALANSLASVSVNGLLVNDWVELRQHALAIAAAADVESAAIADRNGLVIVDTGQESGEIERLDPDEVSAKPGEPLAVRISPLTGRRVIEISTPVFFERSGTHENRLGTVRLRLDLSKIDSETARLQGRLLGIGAIAVLIGLVSASLFTNKITRPVEKLVAGTIRAASGDLRVRVDEDSRDEIGELARNFNHMTQELSKERRTIQELNRSLEAQVEERTAELRSTNEDLERVNTNLVQTVADLRRTQSQLVQSEKMASLGQLVAGVVHELNNPLNFIYNGINPLNESLTELKKTLGEPSPSGDGGIAGQIDSMEKLASVIREGARRATLIVRDLRTFCRPDESERKVGDLHQGIESTVNLLAHKIKNRIAVVREYGSVPPFEFYPSQFNQVIMNLLSNAIDAIEGQGTITVATRREGDDVVFSVADTGKGIPPDVLSHIFEPFFTTKQIGKGMGLGLSITYGIVEKHGGRIDVSSEVGKGTTIVVRIPFVVPPSLRKENA